MNNIELIRALHEFHSQLVFNYKYGSEEYTRDEINSVMNLMNLINEKSKTNIKVDL